MHTRETSDIMRRFNDAFLTHQPALLDDLIAENCVMESIQPAPDGTRYEGREACLAFWQALAVDPDSFFTVEDVAVAGERAVIRWRFHYGEGPQDTVRGVNVMLVRDGLIVEALGYAKVPPDRVPLADV